MDMESFLRGGPIASRVRLPVRAVVSRGSHSLRDVQAIAESGVYAIPAEGSGGRSGEGEAELEVSGVVLARGRVVRKGGRLFFKVTELGSAGGGRER